MTRQQALAKVQTVVDNTKAKTLNGIPVRPQNARDTGCTKPDGTWDGTSSVPYGFDFSIPTGVDPLSLVRSTADYWRSLGFDVRPVALQSDNPRVFGYTQGFDYGFEVDTQSRKGGLGGNTPCLPDPTATTAAH